MSGSASARTAIPYRDLAELVRVFNKCDQHAPTTWRALGIGSGAFWYRLRTAEANRQLKERIVGRRKQLEAEGRAQRQATAQTLAQDRVERAKIDQHGALKARYAEALEKITQLEKDLGAFGALHTNVETWKIAPRQGSGTSEGALVVLASDWHVEEEVGDEVGGLNRYTLDIAKSRAEQFFLALVRLTRLLQQDIKIDEVVLALLGDFISNDIHDELVEVNQKTPIDALVFAQNLLATGIEFILEHTKVKLTIPCHSGNHARTTKTTRFTTENGHSLEYLMYLHLATYFRGNPRVQFILAPGYHSYVTVYDTVLRFHHGHAVKYQGGIGGIFIPTFKKIAQWNKAKVASLDCFGHFHQAKDGGNFISNGSLIGYNGYALSIGADFEAPKQQMFLLDKKRGRTCVWPILPKS